MIGGKEFVVVVVEYSTAQHSTEHKHTNGKKGFKMSEMFQKHLDRQKTERRHRKHKVKQPF